MPRSSATRVASAFKQRSGYFNGTTSDQEALVKGAMCQILAALRAQSWSFQTSHWQVKGDPYYGDHLLFQRLYEEVQGEIDSLAEKIVGYFGPAPVDSLKTLAEASLWVQKWGSIECLHTRGLQSENDLQDLLKKAYDAVKETGGMTLGLDDFIMALANSHESHIYLLQQRISPR